MISLILLFNIIIASFDNIKSIINMPKPIYGEFLLEYEQKTVLEFPIFINNTENYEAYDFDVDIEENIIAITNAYILKISKDSEIIVSKKFIFGQEPGEFQQIPNKVSCDYLGNIYIFDRYKIVLFDKNLTFQKNINLLLLPEYDVCINKMCLMYTMRRDVSNNNELALYKINSNGKAERQIVSLSIDENSTKISEINISISHPYKKRAFYSIINENGLLYADNTNYQVFSYDEDGTMKESISIKQKPQKVSIEEKNAIEKIVNNTKISGVQIKITPNIPENRPFISGLLSDEKGLIYVIREKNR